MHWRARKCGLSDDDLRQMSMDELDLWLELSDWVTSPEEGRRDAGTAATEAEKAFFHL